MPNYDKPALTAAEIDDILKLRSMAIPEARAYSYNCENEQLTCLNTLDTARKIAVLCSHLEFDKINKPGALRKIVNKSLKGFHKGFADFKAVEFVVPVQTQIIVNKKVVWHWILIYLTPTAQFNPRNATGYKLTVVDPAVSGISNYSEQFQNVFAADGFASEFEDLSGDQMLNNPRSSEYINDRLYKDGTLWSSGHIFIDNALRLIRGNPIIPPKFHTFLYKKDLLQENLQLINLSKPRSNEAQLTDTNVDNLATTNEVPVFEGVVSNLFEQSLIAQLKITDVYIKNMLQNQADILNSEVINQMTEHLFTSSFFGMVALTERCKLSAANLDDMMYKVVFANVRHILKLKQNIEALGFGCFLYEINKLRNLQNVPGFFYTYFTAIATLSTKIAKHELKSIRQLTAVYKSFLELQAQVLNTKPVELSKQPEIILNYFERLDELLLVAPNFFADILKYSRTELPKIHSARDHFRDVFNDYPKKYKRIQECFAFLRQLPNHEQEKLLLAEEQQNHDLRAAEAEKVRIALEQSKLRKNLDAKRIVTNAPPGIAVTPTDKVQNLIDSLKKTTVNNLDGLFASLDKVNNILAIAHNHNLILTMTHKLQMASCLIVSFSCLEHKLSDLKQLEPLVMTVHKLCNFSNDTPVDLQLNANLLMADLYCQLGKIYDKICNHHKYRLLGNTLDRFGLLKIICRPENVGVRFALMQEYVLTMAEMNHYLDKVNALTKDLPLPDNPDGLYWSIEQYRLREKEYQETVKLYESQNTAYSKREEEFEGILLTPSMREKYFPVTLPKKRNALSRASLVSRAFKKDAVEYLWLDMQGEHQRSTQQIQALTETLKAKSGNANVSNNDQAKDSVTREPESFAYLDEMPLYKLRRTYSFDGDLSKFERQDAFPIRLRRTQSMS